MLMSKPLKYSNGDKRGRFHQPLLRQAKVRGCTAFGEKFAIQFHQRYVAIKFAEYVW